jgi:predicted DNA-binding transcriptional regulator AlpA
VLHRKKVDGVEVDILLPRQRVAIEYDGKRWHQDKVNEDNKKTRFLADRGYRLLRVRERGLPRVRGQFVTVDPKDLRKHDIDAVLRLIIGNIPAPKGISDYLKSKSFQNEDGYLRLMESFPTTPNKNLQSTHPEITKQWSARNDPLLPSAFSYGSNYSAWWQCEVDQQHVWQMPIKSRTGQDQGCPYCSGNRISNSNSLAAKREDLLSFWNHELNTVFPDQVSIGSRRMVWWKCRRNGGHSYKMTVKHKVGGQGCAVCSGKQIIPESSFGALYPEQANYWDKTRNGDLGPLQVAPFSSKRVFWACKNGHTWELQVSKMTKRKRGCIQCSRRQGAELILEAE